MTRNESTSASAARLTDDERAVIAILQEDGRRPFSDMARDLGVGESTVRRTVHRLIDDRVIAVTAVANPRLLGLEAIAWVGMRVDWGKADGLRDGLLEVRGVDYVVTTTGRFNVMAEVSARDLQDLAERIDIVRKLPGIASTESFIYLDLFHQEYQWAGAETGSRADRSARPAGRDLSHFDQQLVIELRRDGRRSFRQIGRDLGVPEHQVRTAYGSLVDQGILRVMAVLNPARLGLDVMAWIGFKTDTGRPAAEVAQAIADHPSVDYVVICTGRYDVMAEVVCRSNAELIRTVEGELGPLAGVESLEVFPYLELKYRDESVWSAGRVTALER
jgi:Lrp/AsnC family transcriptional regulator for asnA, asnC and gidA